MEMTSVPQSTHVSEYGYDPESKTLAVRFARGVLCHYFNVPAEVVAELREAPSIGGFVNARVRGRFAFKPIDETETETED